VVQDGCGDKTETHLPLALRPCVCTAMYLQRLSGGVRERQRVEMCCRVVTLDVRTRWSLSSHVAARLLLLVCLCRSTLAIIVGSRSPTNELKLLWPCDLSHPPSRIRLPLAKR
jgi:hypothetical protein